ncbi:MAG: amidohydrolase [Actinobacteria bacterium]|nr:MAG: amidohydrolase [Actinomycetota bacterium]
MRYPLSPGVDGEQGWHREHPVDTETLLAQAEAAGVRALALVQAISCYGFDNRYVLDSARAHPQRTIAVGGLRPDDPGAVAALRRDVIDGGARGVRLFSVGGTTAPLDHPAMRAVMATAADLDIPVVMLTAPGQLASILAVVDAFPSVRFVLDHCGFADLGGDDSFPHDDALFALAQSGNSHLKVSSMTLRATSHPEALWSTLVSRFGSERLMWGSDYPHTNEPSYAALVALALETTAALTEGARVNVLAGTARRLWPEFG